MWPHPPLKIQRAWTHGLLYDLGPYPALRPGCGRVAGQLWTFSAEHMLKVLQTLDRIEGTDQPGEKNEYDRVLTSIQLACGQQLRAWTYVYADEAYLSGLKPMDAGLELEQQCYSIWPADTAWLPSPFSKP